MKMTKVNNLSEMFQAVPGTLNVITDEKIGYSVLFFVKSHNEILYFSGMIAKAPETREQLAKSFVPCELRLVRCETREELESGSRQDNRHSVWVGASKAIVALMNNATIGVFKESAKKHEYQGLLGPDALIGCVG